MTSLPAAAYVRAQPIQLIITADTHFCGAQDTRASPENEEADKLADTKELPPPTPFLSQKASSRVANRSEESADTRKHWYGE